MASPKVGPTLRPGNYSERVIREYFLKPFETAVKDGHVQTVMASYNEIDGIPSHSNKHLLDDILRHEWGFDGVIVSDYFGITDLVTLHHVVATNAEAAKMALEAGVEIELPFEAAYPSLVDQVHQGKVSESRLTGRSRIFFGQSSRLGFSKILTWIPIMRRSWLTMPNIRNWRCKRRMKPSFC